ncbi:MAG: hypothetical protein KGH79_01810 [Patescibacteria group bacterium]|nr:hypothetical protein [Patescibacteria group bacterium]
MIAATKDLVDIVRESLKNKSAHADGIIPIDSMGRHFCSLQQIQDVSYKQLFALPVDDKEVFVYFKL